MQKDVKEDIVDIKNSLKGIEQKIASVENVLEQLFELINNITIFIDDAEDINEVDEDEEDWTPYDDRNFIYDDDDENYGENTYWLNNGDDS